MSTDVYLVSPSGDRYEVGTMHGEAGATMKMFPKKEVEVDRLDISCINDIDTHLVDGYRLENEYGDEMALKDLLRYPIKDWCYEA